MDRIDAHQHYWDMSQSFRLEPYPEFLGVVTYGWKQAGLDPLDRSFLPEHLAPELAASGVTQTIVVDALNVAGETDWLLELASAHDSIAGVVGWVDMTQPPERVAADLAARRRHRKFVGVRHLSQFEPDDDWLLRPDVVAGIGALEAAGVPMDLLVNPVQLKRVPALSERRPDLPMVLDHLGKPYIRRRELEPWATDLRAAARNPRLLCKLSGMITEADWRGWTNDDLVPYVETALDAFGVERVMFGSDWPVATLAGGYAGVVGALTYCLERIFGPLDAATERAIFRDNAARFYGLPG